MSRLTIGEYVPEAGCFDAAGIQTAEIYTYLIKGNSERALPKIQEMFAALRTARCTFEEKRSFCVGVYIEIITKSIRRSSFERLKKIADIAVCPDLNDIENIIMEEAEMVAAENMPDSSIGYNSLIKETLHIIDKNIGNENLSLRWIAGNILYTNVDYLGKMFKKETGKNFSYYVMEKRMEIAKKLLKEGNIDKIYEVAERVGYGSNSQYFSQVFKKYTGVSPLEYKEAQRQYKKAVHKNI
ncbi:MAG: helix-turn-helix domain-containing protein [bacterium]|nr:helix-turn-helix domain-containing protein [bacterium]